jgi:hypothetical protein
MNIFTDRYGDLRFGTMLLIVFAGAVVLTAALFAIIVPVVRHYDHVACNAYEEQTTRNTRFVVYHILQWDCLTPSADGRWVPIDSIREVPR